MGPGKLDGAMNSVTHSRLLHEILYSSAVPTGAKLRTAMTHDICGMRGKRREDEDEGNGVERSNDGPMEDSRIGISETAKFEIADGRAGEKVLSLDEDVEGIESCGRDDTERDRESFAAFKLAKTASFSS